MDQNPRSLMKIQNWNKLQKWHKIRKCIENPKTGSKTEGEIDHEIQKWIKNVSKTGSNSGAKLDQTIEYLKLDSKSKNSSKSRNESKNPKLNETSNPKMYSKNPKTDRKWPFLRIWIFWILAIGLCIFWILIRFRLSNWNKNPKFKLTAVIFHRHALAMLWIVPRSGCIFEWSHFHEPSKSPHFSNTLQ